MLDMFKDSASDFLPNNSWVIFPFGILLLFYLAALFYISAVFLSDWTDRKNDFGYKASLWYVPIFTIISIPLLYIILPDRITNHYLQEFGLKTEKQVKVKNHRELPSSMKQSPLLKD